MAYCSSLVKPERRAWVASLLDASATLVPLPQRHQVLVLVVPLAANNGMGLHESGVIDRALALGEIHIRLEGIHRQLVIPRP
jgi:hypothetical protein